MEFLKFIFSSFWVWLGFVVLILTAGEAVAGILKECRQKRKISVNRVGDVTRMEIDNAGRGDVQTVTRSVVQSGAAEVEAK